MTTLYTLSSLPSTLSTMTPPMLRSVLTKRKEGKENESLELLEDDGCDNLEISPRLRSRDIEEKNALNNDDDVRHAILQFFTNWIISIFQDRVMFCSPFRRRKKKKEKLDLDSYHLTREEAWQLYLTKLEEEANYLTVPEEAEEDICTCPTCIVSLKKHFMALSAYLEIDQLH